MRSDGKNVMHLRSTTLVAFCDAEAAAGRSRRIARHLSKCERCRHELRRIQSEKDELSAGAGTPALDSKQGLAGVLSAISAWQAGKTSAAASELKSRLRWQMETFFGSPAAVMVGHPGIRAEELLGKAREMLDVFLGPGAAEAVIDDILRGVDCVGRETWG
jgi:anti-sigma factor RsiW